MLRMPQEEEEDARGGRWRHLMSRQRLQGLGCWEDQGVCGQHESCHRLPARCPSSEETAQRFVCHHFHNFHNQRFSRITSVFVRRVLSARRLATLFSPQSCCRIWLCAGLGSAVLSCLLSSLLQLCRIRLALLRPSSDLPTFCCSTAKTM